MSSIPDGTSNTLFVGERTTRTHMLHPSGDPTRAYARGTFWANSFNLYSLSGAYNQSASLLADYDACIGIASDAAQCKYGWGSFHNGLINFVFGDGSVRPIKTSIDMQVFTGLATVGNGEPVQAD
jgi:prepilin-type processing-associated H-X9-DG protein